MTNPNKLNRLEQETRLVLRKLSRVITIDTTHKSLTKVVNKSKAFLELEKLICEQ
ncbi:MAG: hypothetical protein Q8L34_06160 [Candidatus Woesearchaeota archaeon]|nr:hypothetical protein [Candidatus Woesearchaeota archaeon]